jgi:hypothetical protein
MTMQREITEQQPLLDRRGALVRPGYATRMMFEYDPRRIHARPFALKEWDFYQICAGEYILQLTYGHVSYVANFAATLFSVNTGQTLAVSRMRPLPLRSLRMPKSPEDAGVLHAQGKDYEVRFEMDAARRHLVFRAHDKIAGDADIDIELHKDPDNDKLVIATPFPKPNQFYLNCKENFFGVRGHARLGDLRVDMGAEDTAVMDWGRGVWPFSQEWFWGNGAAFVDGNRFGFNLGWGFGDLSHATENMFFWNGRAVKLGALRVDRDPKDYMAPWRFCDEAERFDLTMTPVFDHFTRTKIAFIQTQCHQVHGRWSGRVTLPDGERKEISNVPAFCEHAENRW